jgi:hypothetical protein
MRQMAGAWRKAYVITAMIALYLNVFVLVAQLFLKVPALKAMAPTGSRASLPGFTARGDSGVHHSDDCRREAVPYQSGLNNFIE